MNMSVIVAGALPRNLHYDYNAEGEVTGVTLPANPRTACQYNQVLRMEMNILPDGSRLLTLQDTDNELT